MRDSGLLRYGLKIVGGVDTDPALVGTDIDGVPVWMPEQLPRLVKEHQISIAIIAVPIEAAQSAADSAVEAGIRALWNFTPTRIRVDRGVVVTNTSIYAHLAVMYNRLGMLNLNSDQ